MGHAQEYALGFGGQERARLPAPDSQYPSAEFSPHKVCFFNKAAKVIIRGGTFCILIINVVNRLPFVAE